ncbi:MAG: hypothetical protein KA190_17465 [Kofleriaceae bacterium]|nr:hypothetical protein [Kofleriaceae bacterium]
MSVPRIVQVALALLALVFVPVLSSQAVATAVVHCCCGPHHAAEHCGCPDCPSGHEAEQRRQADDDHPRVVSCATGEHPTLIAIAFIVPPQFALVTLRPAPPARLEPFAPHQPAPPEPSTPPPRPGAVLT